MKIAITALSEKNQTVRLIGFDPRTPDKIQSQTINHTPFSGLRTGIVDGVKFFTMTHLFKQGLTAEKLTADILSRLSLLCAKVVDLPASVDTMDGYAAAFLMSTVNKDTVYLSLGHEDFEPSPVKVTSHKQAKSRLNAWQVETDMGGRNMQGGELFRNGNLVGALSYNGRLWQWVGWGGASNGSELDDFMSDEDAASLMASRTGAISSPCLRLTSA